MSYLARLEYARASQLLQHRRLSTETMINSAS
jgi:hypothetical protein